jgi:hypothetical protein
MSRTHYTQAVEALMLARRDDQVGDTRDAAQMLAVARKAVDAWAEDLRERIVDQARADIAELAGGKGRAS